MLNIVTAREKIKQEGKNKKFVRKKLHLEEGVAVRSAV